MFPLRLMMIALSFSIAVPLIALAAPKKKKSSASEEVVTTHIVWRGNLNEAMAEAGSTGRPIFIDFTAEWCGYCKKLDAGTFKDPAVIKLLNGGFIPVKVDADEHPDVVKQFSVTGFPAGVMIRANGEEFDRIRGYAEAPSYSGFLTKALKTLEGLPPLEGGALFAKTFETAETAFNNQRYGMAWAAYSRLAAEQGAFLEIENAKKRLVEIEKIAGERLEAAKSAVEAKDYAAAAKQLGDLAKNFGSAKAVSGAKEIQKKLAADPVAQKKLREIAGQELYNEAIAELDAKRYGNAMQRLDAFLGKYEDLPLAKEAQVRLEKLRSDKDIVRQAQDEVASAQCKAWLSLAKTWKLGGKNDRSKDYLDKVIATFPDSSFADTAREMLSDL